jgi:hypothetical protein
LAHPLITEATSVDFDFFFAGEPDNAFEVGAAAKKDGIFGCRRAFRIKSAMSAFDELERGHNFGGKSFFAKSSSSSFDLLRSSSCSPFSDMLSAFSPPPRSRWRRPLSLLGVLLCFRGESHGKKEFQNCVIFF